MKDKNPSDRKTILITRGLHDPVVCGGLLLITKVTWHWVIIGCHWANNISNAPWITVVYTAMVLILKGKFKSFFMHLIRVRRMWHDLN